MAVSFTTNPVALSDLLKSCEAGTIQLPDFQRSWVWDEERIKKLVASVSQAFPVGALMALATGGEVDFAPRLIEGAPEANKSVRPQSLLLDGQQRMTSLFQTTKRKSVVHTVTARGAKVKRWYYIDIRAALDPSVAREDAIVGVPEDKVQRENFGKDISLDLSSQEREFDALMFPLNQVFDWYDWAFAFQKHWEGAPETQDLFTQFREGVLKNFEGYQVPVITLGANTSTEAVCLVFEKVNTGGKPLDAFELVTAIYATKRFRLREDWFARQSRLKHHRVLEGISSTEFMQSISLLHTKAIRQQASAVGREGRDLPQVSATRQSLLKLPLEAYEAYADKVEAGFVRAAKFLHGHKVYRGRDLPYQSQVTPLAAILTELGDSWENDEVQRKLTRWYWNGVFGELYGSATESRFARDFLEVPAWLTGGAEPSTIVQSTFDAQRLGSMRTRLSAAYKGVSALLLKSGAHDFLSGQANDQAVFFDEMIDIHHIFPKAWCEKAKIPVEEYDCIINKTPLSARTNRILGGVAPTEYLARLEKGWEGSPAIAPDRLDALLRTHLIDTDSLRADDFAGFLAVRREHLLKLIEEATGKTVYRGEGANEVEGYGADEDSLGDALPALEAEAVA